MDEHNLNELIDRDERLKAGDAADTHQTGETRDQGLELLHRVRDCWNEWPASDPALGVTASNDDLQWGVSGGPPATLGRFKICRELGRGGFGIVLLAHDPKLQQDVALKIPRAEAIVSEEARARMSREARAATILAHPAIVPVYETGTVGSLQYISYRYCGDESLTDWISPRRGKIPPNTSAAIVQRLAEAAQHAHSKGIVHRDLKPSNILIEQDSAAIINEAQSETTVAAQLRVADFGLARVDEGRSDITRTGTPLGTPAYMSPEQARGETKIGPTTDIFSLGVILYELLTGQTPFKRDTDLATLRAVEKESHRAIKTLNPEVSKDLAAICDKCLAKDIADRYTTAQALDDDLRRFLAGHPVAARPIGRHIQFARWCYRNKALATAVLIAFVSLTAGLGVSATLWRRAEQKADDAVLHAGRSRAAVQSLLSAVANEPLLKREGMEQFRQKLHGAAAEYYASISDESPDDPRLIREHLETLRGLATMHRLLADHERALKIRQAAMALARQLPHAESILASLMSQQAADLVALQRYSEAIRLADQAADIVDFDEAAEHTQITTIDVLNAAAESLIGNGQVSEAANHINRALELGTRFTGTPALEWPQRLQANDALPLSVALPLAGVLRNQVQVCYGLDNQSQLQPYADAAMEMYEALQQRDPTLELNCLESKATLHYILANSCLRDGDIAAAESSFQSQRAALQKAVEKHPEIGHLYTNLANNAFHIGSLFFDRQEFAEAIEFAEGQLVWMEEPKAAFPQLSDSFLRTEIDLRHGISLSHRGLENTAAAHQQLEHAIALAERLCDNPQQSLTMVGVLGNLYGDLANMQSQSGELGAAAMTYQRAVDWLESVLQQAPDSDAEDFVTGVYYNYALLLEKLQRDDEALELIEQALTQDVSPSYVPALAAAYRLQIRMLMAGQEPGAAIVAYEQFKRRLPELVEDHFKAALRVVADYPDAGEASDFFVTAAIDRLEQLVASGTMSVEKFERLHQLPPFAKLREHPAFPGIAATVRKLSFSN